MQASRLIRRVGVVLAVLLVLVLAATLALSLYGQWLSARALERYEAVFGPADLARFIRPEVPETDNAATWLTAGAGAIVLSSEGRALVRRREGQQLAWSGAEIELAGRIVESNEPALALLRRAAGCAGSSYSLDYRQGAEMELPPLVELLDAASLLWIDARLALEAGDLPRLRIDLATLARLADTLASESLLITVLVALATDRHYLDLVHRLVTGGADQALLDDVEAVLAGRDRQADYLRSLAAEGAMSFGLWSESLPVLDSIWLPGWLQALLNRVGAQLLLPAVLDVFSAVGELVAKPWPQILAASAERPAGGFLKPLAAMLYPNLIDSIGRLKAVQSASRLALEAIRQRRALASAGAYHSADGPPRIDPYTGQEVRVDLRSDGSLVLSAPEAQELWQARYPHLKRFGAPPFTWALPATR